VKCKLDVINETEIEKLHNASLEILGKYGVKIGHDEVLKKLADAGAAVEQAGPGGNYLTDDLTLELMRSDEFFWSEYADLTGGYGNDAPGMYEIAHQTALDLVANYKPKVPERVRQAIKNFFKDRYSSKAIANM